MRTILALILLVSFSAFGQSAKPVNSVATIAELIARRAVNAEEIEVRNFSTSILWDQPRTFRHVIDATNSHDGVHYLTNSGASGRWVSADRLSANQKAEWFGADATSTIDSTPAVQNAINYCYSNNVPSLEFPAGTILISEISFTGTGLVGGLALRGQPGLRSIIRGTAAKTMFTLHTMRHVTIEHLWFDANNTATNILTINNSTEFKIVGNDFYRANGSGLLFTGNQNYGHLIQFNTFINNSDIGLDFNGVSATANSIVRNKFESPGFTNAIGIRLKGGVANQDYTANVFQSLRYGMYLEGVVGSGQINNSIDHNYFEVFTQNPLALGPGQHSVLAVTRNYFYQDFTGGTWALRDTNATTLYGFRWKDNAITSDSGKALSLTNSLVRDWEIHSAPTDIASDYELPANVPIKFWTQSQPALSVIVTNFTVSGAATNLSIPGDLLPSRVEITGSSNMTFSVGGFTYPGTTLTLKNAGTNTVTFTGINTVIRAGTEDTFTFRNSAWTRYVYPYLPDYGGTLYGSLTITNALNVAGFSEFSGAVKLGNIISNFNGLITGGSIGATQAFVLKANADAMLTIQRGANNLAHFGTNDGIRFERPLTTLASTGVLTHVYGFATNPAAAPREGIAMTLANLASLIGGGGGLGGLVIGSGDTNLVTNAVSSATTTPTRTNGTFAVNVTAVPANLLTGTIDDLRIPSSILRSNDAAATYAPIANPTFTGTVTMNSATIGTVTVTTNLNVPVDPYAAGWATKTNAPTKKDVYDKLESLTGVDYFGNSIFAARPGFLLIDHLMSQPASGANGDIGTIAVNNSGSVTFLAGDADRPGMRLLRATGANQNPIHGWSGPTTATSIRATNFSGTGVLHYETEIRTPDKSSGNAVTNVYSLQVGFSSAASTSTNAPQDGAYLIHQTNLIGTVNWAFQCSSNNNFSTAVDTGVAFTNSAWYRLGVRLNGTNAVAFINGNAVATNTSHVPFGRQFGAFVRLCDIIGTTTLDVYLDKAALGFRP